MADAMIAQRFRELIRLWGTSERWFGSHMDISSSTADAMGRGKVEIPPPVMAYLEECVARLQEVPKPMRTNWTPGTAMEFNMPSELARARTRRQRMEEKRREAEIAARRKPATNWDRLAAAAVAKPNRR